MIKESTPVIYNCLGETFWTSQKCQKCATSFTSADYQTHNYQLYFTEVLTAFPSCFSVTFQLTHQQCPFNCLICSNLLRQKWPKKEKSTN